MGSNDGKERLGAVEAKIDGSVEIRIGVGLGDGWTFRLSASELWRLANDAKRALTKEAAP